MSTPHPCDREERTTLFAALNAAEGIVIDKCQLRRRRQEWIHFLKEIDSRTPADLDLHLIADNYATHKHPKARRWLARHPRFHMHFIPTSSSWFNLVERFLSELTNKRRRRENPCLRGASRATTPAVTAGPPKPTPPSPKSAAPKLPSIRSYLSETVR